MGDMQNKIDDELGRDIEQTRIDYLKYLNLGRQVERAEILAQNPAVITQEMLEKAVREAKNAGALEALDKVDMVLRETAELARDIETDEKARLADIVKMGEQGPMKKEVADACVELIQAIDQKHTLVIKEKRDPALVAIRDLYTTV